MEARSDNARQGIALLFVARTVPARSLGTAVLAGLVAACGGGGGGSPTPAPAPTATTFPVGGTVSGLTGTLVLRDNGGDDLTVKQNGSFQFATALSSGAAYAVTVATAPAGETCSVASASGTVGSAAISNVSVTCSAAAGSPTPVGADTAVGCYDFTRLYTPGTTYSVATTTTSTATPGVTASGVSSSEVIGPSTFNGTAATEVDATASTNGVPSGDVQKIYSSQPSTNALTSYGSFETDANGTTISSVDTPSQTEDLSTLQNGVPVQYTSTVVTTTTQPSQSPVSVTTTTTGTSTYLGRTTITVPAGTYQTCKLQVVGTSNGNPTTTTVTTWVIDGVGLPVQIELTVGTLGDTITTSATAVTLNGAAL